MNSKPTIYFPGLNGLRAIAALSVVISHTLKEQFGFGLPVLDSLPVGGYAVTVFFTLSGFLITYLLLTEKKDFGSINIRSFYVRRILRIWPLYFLYIILIYISYKNVNNSEYLYLYFIFLPNIAFNLNLYPQAMAHLWSIGIEEQFYAFWPLVVSRIKSLKKFIFIFIVVMLLLKVTAKLLSYYLNNELPYSIISCMRFECMAIGALFSIYFIEGKFNNLNKRILNITEILFWLLFFYSFFFPLSFFSILGDDVIAVLTGFIIITQILKKNVFISLENKYFNLLGKISYGIYVYHPLVITFLVYFIYKKLNISLHNSFEAIFLELFFTILVSYLSYRYFELFFLKYKNKFSRIVSGNELKD